MFISLATFIAIEQKLQTYVKTHGHNQSLSSTLKDGQTKLSANHARVNTIAYGKPIPTASGHRMSFEWTSPDGKDKKEGIALVDYPTKSVFVAFEGTPILSNFSLCPTAVNFSNESGEVLATHEFGTSEALYKLLNALVFDGFKGCDEAVGKIINAKDVRDCTLATKEIENYLPSFYDHCYRTECMQSALAAKFSNQLALDYLREFFQTLLTGVDGKPAFSFEETITFDIMEANAFCDFWAGKITMSDTFKKVTEKVGVDNVPVLGPDGKQLVKHIKGFKTICAELEFDFERVVNAAKKLGKNLLGHLLEEVIKNIQTLGDEEFKAKNARRCDIIVSDKRKRANMDDFFALKEAPVGVKSDLFAANKATYTSMKEI